MKFLHVIPFFTPSRGGSVSVLYSMSKELSKRGHEVCIITTDFEYDKAYAEQLKDIDIIPFKCLYNIGLFLYSPDMKDWLDYNIKNYDIIHLHNYRSYQNALVIKYAEKYKVPYVLQAHGSIPRIMEMKSLKRFYDLVWGSKILKNAAAVIALNNFESDQYKQLEISPDRIKILPNGIDLSEFVDIPKDDAFKKQFNIGPEEKLILYLGRLHKIKGCDLLLKAFVDLVREHNFIRLIFVGPDDGFLESLKSEAKLHNLNNRVIFTGPIYGRDKLSAYHDAYIYVLPSIYETFPMTILESCACGTPVIVTDRCGIADIVEGNIGYVVEYDKDQLKDAISKILSDDKIRSIFSERCRQLVEDEFNEVFCISKLEIIYQDIIGGSR